MASFSRLVRFLAKDGRIYNGDAVLPPGVTDLAKTTKARMITGDIFGTHTVTSTILEIQRLLCPLPPTSIRTVRCLGLNYAQHAAESNMPLPKYPVLFYKPPTSVAGPLDPIPVPRVAQSPPTLDYEVELVAVIGRPCRDVTTRDALGYILGYCVGNDVSHREWQIARGGSQWSVGKGFDGWAPMGPGIVSAEVIKDPQALEIGTRVNGVEVQRSRTADMVFGVAETVSFLSQGVTLMPGDLIFTGTPQGVGMGRKPQLWLKDGDVVEVSLEGVGTCTNKVEFEKSASKL